MPLQTTHQEIRVEDRLIHDFRANRGWFIGLGVVFLVLGLAAIAFPWVATLSLELAIGVLLLIAGAAQLIQSLQGPRWSGSGMSMGMAVLALIAGFLMLLFPMAGVITLSTLVMIFLLVSGAIKTTFAFRIRPARGWGWILASGLLSLVLGLLILLQFFTTVPWLLGLMLGVDFLFTGTWMVILASQAGRLE